MDALASRPLRLVLFLMLLAVMAAVMALPAAAAMARSAADGAGSGAPAPADAAYQRLVDAAKAAGGADNVTCILLRYNAIPEAEPVPPPPAASFDDLLA